MTELNPEFIAEFDQALAEITETLEQMVTVYGLARDEFGTEKAILGLEATLNKRAQNTEAACQYLAVAIYRIHEMQTAALQIIADITEAATLMENKLKDTDSPPTN